jgi:maleylpyruvate isomerase
MTTGLTLRGYSRSSAAYRVQIVLYLKCVDYALVNHGLRSGQQRETGYRAGVPHGLVPALDTGQRVVIQSTAILEWMRRHIRRFRCFLSIPWDALSFDPWQP